MLKVLVPVGGLAVVVILVGVVIALVNLDAATPASDGSSASAVPPGDGTRARGVPPSPAASLPKYTFSLDGPEWKDVDTVRYPGLKYWDATEGTGTPCPPIEQQPGVVPVMHYTGWLLDGAAFDSSKLSGKPLTLGLASLIQGWQAGVPGMKPGGVRRLIIPSQFGYGSRGSPPNIPPNATLVFEMELQKVQ